MFTVISLSFSAVSAPSIPHGFEGYVIDEDGDLYPDGINISAKLGDNFYNTTVVNGSYGSLSGGEQFIVYGGSTDLGKTIYFYVDEVQAPQTAIFTERMINIDYSSYFNLSFDVTPPVISSISHTVLGTNSARITWTTDKISNSKVNYGKTTSLGSSKSDGDFVLNHEITLTSLSSGTKYYYEVVSYDYTGLTTTDSNSGNFYSFTTEIGSSDDGDGDGGSGGDVDGGGGTGSDGVDIITSSPVANAGGPYYGTIGGSLSFDCSKSYDLDGYIVSYTWDFGDGNTATTTDTRISHEYETVDNYSITLTVEDDGGLTDSDDTYANISSDDTDADGWSNDAENYYGTDPENSTDYPVDFDEDGIPDTWDPDDDNDGLNDDDEAEAGTDSKNSKDIIRIFNNYGLFYLIDTNNDNIVDKFYKKSEGAILTTNLFKLDDTSFLIDIEDDGTYDYIYYSLEGTIDIYDDSQTTTDSTDNTLLIAGVVIIVILAILGLIFIKRKR